MTKRIIGVVILFLSLTSYAGNINFIDFEISLESSNLENGNINLSWAHTPLRSVIHFDRFELFRDDVLITTVSDSTINNYEDYTNETNRIHEYYIKAFFSAPEKEFCSNSIWDRKIPLIMPYSEHFDTYDTNLPLGWEANLGTNSKWRVDGDLIIYNGFNNYNWNNDYLYLPKILVSAGDAKPVFCFNFSNSLENSIMNLEVSEDNGITWKLLNLIDGNILIKRSEFISLDDFLGKEIQFRFKPGNGQTQIELRVLKITYGIGDLEVKLGNVKTIVDFKGDIDIVGNVVLGQGKSKSSDFNIQVSDSSRLRIERKLPNTPARLELHKNIIADIGDNSKISITSGGELDIHGETENRVVFRNKNSGNIWKGIEVKQDGIVNISHADISNCDKGISANSYLGNKCNINSNYSNFNNCNTGIQLFRSDSLHCFSSTFNNCNKGLNLIYSNNYNLRFNTINGDSVSTGISLTHSTGIVSNNTIENCNYGLFIVNSSPQVLDNTIRNNSIEGIHVSGKSAVPNLIHSDFSTPYDKNNKIYDNGDSRDGSQIKIEFQ